MNIARGLLVLTLAAGWTEVVPDSSAAEFRSHPPLRQAPPPSQRPLAEGPARFADARNGNDDNPGTEAAPWKTIGRAVRQLQPGETLYLREGAYYENVYLARTGRQDAPLTIRSYPGERAVLDGGLREFFEAPETCWEPVEGSSAGEFRSVRSDPNLRDVVGSFGDSMIGLQTYYHAEDLRSDNETIVALQPCRDAAMGAVGHTRAGHPRRVFNNVFLHLSRLPGFLPPNPAENSVSDGNLYWSPQATRQQAQSLFQRFRASDAFEHSRQIHAPGSTTHSITTDPHLVRIPMEPSSPADYRLKLNSPAIDLGVEIPADWPDPLRNRDAGRPDIGALPLGSERLQAGRQPNPR